MTERSSATSRIHELLDKTYTDSARWNLEELSLEEGAPLSVGFLNAHAVTSAYDQEDFFTSLMQCNYLLRDGIGVKIALSVFGYQKTENLNGTDLIPMILDKFSDQDISLWGSSEWVVHACKDKLKTAGMSNITSLEHGFHEPDYYLELARKSKKKIVVICMGMPKQELLAKQLVQENLCQLAICAGGWADFYTGVKKRAPRWVRKLSLEWMHRLTKEPTRLGKRYTFGIICFFYVVIRTCLSK